MTSIQKVPEDKLSVFRSALAKAQDSFKLALPTTVAKYLTPERLTKITLSAISRNPLLLQCTPESVLRSVMDAASMGLEPSGGVLGQAYMVPYKNGKTGRYEAQLITGYRGLVSLARRSGDVEDIAAYPVNANDHFVYELGTNAHIEHKPSDAEDPGPLTHVYAVAWLKGTPRPHIEVMTVAKVEAIRKRSRARDSGPWTTDYEEMARKTVVRRISKMLPMSTELARALEIEDAAENGNVIDGGELVASEAPKPKTKQIVERLRGAHNDEPVPDGNASHDSDNGDNVPDVVEQSAEPNGELPPELTEVLAGIGNASTADELAQMIPRMEKLSKGKAQARAAYMVRRDELAKPRTPGEEG